LEALRTVREQALQHFISNSPWDAGAVMREVARGADALAMLFILEERVRHGATVPMLSTADVERLLKHYLPHRDATEQ
jgi:hypothetical protein